MKAITHESLRHGLATDEKRQAKNPRQDSSETETTVWVLIALFFALIVFFGYLFWTKF